MQVARGRRRARRRRGLRRKSSAADRPVPAGRSRRRARSASIGDRTLWPATGRVPSSSTIAPAPERQHRRGYSARSPRPTVTRWCRPRPGILTVNPVPLPQCSLRCPRRDLAPVTVLAAGAQRAGRPPRARSRRRPSPSRSDMPKAHPGTLNYSSPGNGSGAHLAGELSQEHGRRRHRAYSIQRHRACRHCRRRRTSADDVRRRAVGAAASQAQVGSSRLASRARNALPPRRNCPRSRNRACPISTSRVLVQHQSRRPARRTTSSPGFA